VYRKHSLLSIFACSQIRHLKEKKNNDMLQTEYPGSIILVYLFDGSVVCPVVLGSVGFMPRFPPQRPETLALNHNLEGP